MKFKYFLYVLLFSTISGNVFAQMEEKLGSWYIYNGFLNFSPKVELFFETQLRTYEPVSNTQVFFVRPYLSYNFTPNFQLGLGQEYHVSWNYDENSENKVKSNEYRTTLQGMLFQKIDRVTIQHRYRYEFRFLDQKGNQRTRYRFQLNIPITNKKIVKGVLFTTIGGEFLVNTQKELKLSQTRLYAMVGYQFNNSLNFQFGYMNISFPSQPSNKRLQFLLTQKLFLYDY